MVCLKAATVEMMNWRLNETTLYSTLEPCAMCAGAMILSRVKMVVWGAPDLRHGADGSLFNILNQPHPIHKLETRRGVLEVECATLMKQFFKKLRERCE